LHLGGEETIMRSAQSKPEVQNQGTAGLCIVSAGILIHFTILKSGTEMFYCSLLSCGNESLMNTNELEE